MMADTQSSSGTTVEIGAPLPTPTSKLPLRRIGNWFVLEIRGRDHIPGYDPEEVGRGLGEQAFRREVLGDWTATEGKVVYPEYGPDNMATDPLPYNPERPLICGWDLPGGNGGTPAFVPCQMSATGQLFVWEALVPQEDRSVGLWDFADQVAQYIYERFAAPFGRNILKEPRINTIHFGDPAGRQKPPKTAREGNELLEMRSAFDILHSGQEFVTGVTDYGKPIIQNKPGWGWTVQAGEVSLARRMEAMRSLLGPMAATGLSGMIFDPGATVLREALGGGYHYRQRQDGRYELDPDKNWYSHPVNALEYVASRMAKAWEPETEERDDRPRFAPGVRGAGRRRR